MDTTTIFVLFRETNTGRFDDSDGYIEAVYSTAEAAEAARILALRKAKAEGCAVWTDPDDPDADGPADWTHDYRVEEHVIRSEAREPEYV